VLRPGSHLVESPLVPLQALDEGARVVVIRLRSLGDTVLTTPALQLLRQERPDLKITVALDAPFAPLLDGVDYLDRVLPIERGNGRRAIAAVRNEKPDLVWNLHGGPTSRWMTLLSGARYRAGYEHFADRWTYNVRIPRAQTILGRPPDAVVHTAEHHASGVFYLGGELAEIPSARLAAKPLERARPYAVFHVAAAYETKRWPEERFERAAAHVESEYGLEPVLIAGPGQDALLERFPERTRLPGLTVSEILQLMAGAKLFVGCDSGPAHVAAAFGVPSVVVFGSSDSRVWGPWKTRARVVETAWDCKPCPGDRCYAFDEPHCILSVQPEAVERAADALLGSGPDPEAKWRI